MSALQHRLAETADIPALTQLMNEAIAVHLAAHLPPEGVAASYSVMELVSQLIEDGTYFVISTDGAIGGCGGWSRRATLFGGDHSAGRSARLLDPASEPARVRAMYTSPAFARRGVGRFILSLCEEAAAREGFRALELAATLSGLPLYRAYGFSDVEAFAAATPSGFAVPLVRMQKTIIAR